MRKTYQITAKVLSKAVFQERLRPKNVAWCINRVESAENVSTLKQETITSGLAGNVLNFVISNGTYFTFFGLIGNFHVNIS